MFFLVLKRGWGGGGGGWICTWVGLGECESYKEKMNYFRAVDHELQVSGVKTFLVDTKRDFGVEAMRGLNGARIMVALCTSTYGEKTSGTYDTYAELKYAAENPDKLHIIPVQLCVKWPPVPPGPQEGRDLCNFVFGQSRVRVYGVEQNHEGQYCYREPREIAKKIYQHVEDLGLLTVVKVPLPSRKFCGTQDTSQPAVWNTRVSNEKLYLNAVLDDGHGNSVAWPLGAMDLSLDCLANGCAYGKAPKTSTPTVWDLNPPPTACDPHRQADKPLGKCMNLRELYALRAMQRSEAAVGVE